MGSVYLWGLPGLLPLFLGGLLTLPCDMVCHVALWLVLDRSGQWGEALGVLLGVYGRLEDGCYGAPFFSPCNHLN